MGVAECHVEHLGAEFVNTDATTEMTISNDKRRGSFFVIHIPTFHKLTALGDPDMCAAYLILAAGTGGDSRTSTWGSQAVAQRTSLDWRRAEATVKRLEDVGFIKRWVRGRKPRTELLIPVEPPSSADRVAFLPNSFAGGGNQRPPVDRLRRSRDPLAFRLLLDLYSLQNLADNGGVGREWIVQRFKRTPTNARGAFQVWKFHAPSTRIQGDVFDFLREPIIKTSKRTGDGNADAGILERLNILETAGLIEWAYYLAEDASDTGVMLHPVAIRRAGKVDISTVETRLGYYATRAGVALSTGPHRSEEVAMHYEASMPDLMLLPAEKNLLEVRLVGVVRLLYRAKTQNTARWQYTLNEEALLHLQGYRNIIERYAPEFLSRLDRPIADFNDASMMLQRRFNSDSK